MKLSESFLLTFLEGRIAKLGAVFADPHAPIKHAYLDFEKKGGGVATRLLRELNQYSTPPYSEHDHIRKC